MMCFRRSALSVLLAFGTAFFFVAPLAGAHEEVCRYLRADHMAAIQHDPSPGDRKYAPDRAVDILDVKLDVTPDFEKETVAGTARLRFKPIAKPLEELKLDGVNLRVSAVRASQPVRDFAADAEHVTIVFAEPIPAGADAWVEIDYSAEPEMGLYFRTPRMGVAEEDVHCWTQGEPHEARHWFPCFDWPNERATTELICHVPAEMTVVSNGTLLGEKADADGKLKTYHWREEKPHTSYLICFVAGKLAKLSGSHRDVPLGFYSQPSKSKYAQSAFDDTADIMAFFEQEIGVLFPWEKYDQATISDFMWGGMENTTLTTLTQRSMTEPATENIRLAYPLIAHEMAHQWFGDYVTCKDWSHLWLNEGFATYYAHLYEGHKHGRDAMLYGLHDDYREEILPFAWDKRPIAYRKYKRPDEQFDFRAYPKGSWVLHMLRNQLGEDLYRQAIKTYLQRHALGEVQSEDLREVFEELSGKSLDRFFDQWVYHGGMPELEVKYDWMAKEKLAHVTVKQTQTVDANVLLFEIPTKLRFVVDGKAIDEPILIDRPEQDFYVSLPAKPEIVRFDPDYSVLAKIDFELSDELLEAQLRNSDDAMGRVLACEGLAKRKTKGAVDKLSMALGSDPFFGVREAAADALAEIGTPEACAALIANSKQPDARVRKRLVDDLAKCYSDAARKQLLRVVAEEPNPAVAAAAVQGLGKYGGDEAAAALRKALASKSWQNEQAAAAMLAIGERNDPALAKDLIEGIRRRALDVNTRDLLEGMKALAKVSDRPNERDAAFEFFAGYLSDAREPMRLAAIEALGQLHDERARALLDPLSRARGNGRVAEVAELALAALNKKSPEVPAEVAELRSEMTKLRDAQAKLEKQLDELKSKGKAEGAAEAKSAKSGDK